MRVMYDAIDVNNIPASAEMVAGYTSGHWPTFGSLETRFPNAVRVSIAVNAAHNAQVLDVEKGDAIPAEVPEWVLRQRVLGTDPTVYCSTSVWPAVVAACNAAHVALPHWWEAHYDGRAVLSPGSVAKQYLNGPKFDTSIVADYWPGVDPKPVQEDDMTPAEMLAALDAAARSTESGVPVPGTEFIEAIARRVVAISKVAK